jgi:hypothetical protein
MLGSFFILFLSACGGAEVRIRGHFIGLEHETVWLEQSFPDRNTVVDSARTNGRGEFCLRTTLPGGEETFLNLRHRDDVVPLLATRGERIRVMSFGNPDRDYRVSGSPGSELVWRVHKIVSDGAASLDSISRLLVWSSPVERQRLTRAYWDEYTRIKREQIRFIVEHSSSLASIYALNERLPGEDSGFDGTGDRTYYRMVADSVGRHHPDSKYVVALKKSIGL